MDEYKSISKDSSYEIKSPVSDQSSIPAELSNNSSSSFFSHHSFTDWEELGAAADALFKDLTPPDPNELFQEINANILTADNLFTEITKAEYLRAVHKKKNGNLQAEDINRLFKEISRAEYLHTVRKNPSMEDLKPDIFKDALIESSSDKQTSSFADDAFFEKKINSKDNRNATVFQSELTLFNNAENDPLIAIAADKKNFQKKLEADLKKMFSQFPEDESICQSDHNSALSQSEPSMCIFDHHFSAFLEEKLSEPDDSSAQNVQQSEKVPDTELPLQNEEDENKENRKDPESTSIHIEFDESPSEAKSDNVVNKIIAFDEAQNHTSFAFNQLESDESAQETVADNKSESEDAVPEDIQDNSIIAFNQSVSDESAQKTVADNKSESEDAVPEDIQDNSITAFNQYVSDESVQNAVADYKLENEDAVSENIQDEKIVIEDFSVNERIDNSVDNSEITASQSENHDTDSINSVLHEAPPDEESEKIEPEVNTNTNASNEIQPDEQPANVPVDKNETQVKDEISNDENILEIPVNGEKINPIVLEGDKNMQDTDFNEQFAPENIEKLRMELMRELSNGISLNNNDEMDLFREAEDLLHDIHSDTAVRVNNNPKKAPVSEVEAPYEFDFIW